MAQIYKRGDFCSHVQRYKVEKGSEMTHTSIIKPSGAFYIPTDEMDAFYAIYKRAMTGGEDLYMTEKHRDISPFLIDLDFKFEKGEKLERMYSLHDIESVIKLYTTHISEYVEVPSQYDIYLLEKPYPSVDKGTVKDGVHIIIPDIVTKSSVQMLIRKDILKGMKEVLLHLKCVNSIEDIVDEAVIERNNWQMYGSKKPNCEAYKVTHKYVWNSMEKNLEEKKELEVHADLVEILSIRNKFEGSSIKIEKTTVVKEYETIASAKKKRQNTPNPMLQSHHNNKKNIVENLEHIAKLVDILSQDRSNSYSDWVRVGWCLRNIDYRLLPKWIDFSQKSPKFVDGECDKLWNYMRDDGLGIGTLYMWAKQDNPAEFKQIMDADINNLIFASRNETHYDIARVVYFMMKHEFVCASIKSNYWYQFRENRWVPCDSGYSLNSKLSTDVFRQYSTAAAHYHMRAATTENEAEQSQFTDTAKKLGTIATKLKMGPYKENVMNECRKMFYIEKFEEKLDSKCHLIGFENGVYDLELKEFRDGRPEDYISFTTGCNYVEYDADNVYARQMRLFLSQVLTKEHIREYVLLLLSSFLNGNIREERFHIWTGSGCHAIDTPIMLADGSIKKVQDIQVGEQLMGDDSTPRNVMQLFRGNADMYEIIPVKGDKFTVNGEHILSLKATNLQSMFFRKDRNCWAVTWCEFDNEIYVINRAKNFKEESEAQKCYDALKTNKQVIQKGDIIDISVKEYLKNVKRIGERNFYLFREAIEFPEQETKIDPWFMGYWLGNGHSNHSSITTMFDEVAEKVYELYGEEHDVHISDCKGENKANTWSICKKDTEVCLFNKLKSYNVIDNKHIPDEYLHNSKELRMQLLAGILDSDGHYQEIPNQYELTFKSERLIDDTIYLARSLGFACYKHSKTGTWTSNGVKKSGKYFRIQIVGNGIENIPVVVPFKKAHERIKNKDVSVVSFKINRVEDNDFYGFELDGNHRYVMGDFVVTHNSNGKSKIIDLFEQSFGDYCCKFPVTLLTQKRAASNSATSELARAKGKRFAVLQEPSEDEKLNVGLMKELSGGDKIQARALFKDPIEFKPQFKMVLTCNHLPNVPSDDGGTWRRIRLVEFQSKFVADPDPSNENEFPIDTDLSTKFVDWREHFMSLLIEYFKKYCISGIKEPEEVLQCTKEYQKNNDFYLDFIERELEKYDMGFLSVNDAFSVFKYWVKDEVPGLKIKKKDFITALDKTLGKRVTVNRLEGYKGYRVKSHGDTGGDDNDDLN